MSATFTPIDLSALPTPDVIETIDYETLLSDNKALLLSYYDNDQQAEVAATLALESEPLTKLLEVFSYREMLLRQRVNEAAQATMLAYAADNDLDQKAADVNLTRLEITAATDSTDAVMESDEALRERIQMAWEGLSTAGPRNSYIFHARNASGQVADATAVSPSPAAVTVTIQSATEPGTADNALLDTVRSYLSDEERRPLGDRLTVQSAEIIEYQVNATLELATTGAESSLIVDAATSNLTEVVNQRRRLGVEIAASAIYAALHVEGVAKVTLTDWQDVVPTAAQCGYCTGMSVEVAQ
ncbi:baseplate J/gp47 family protein [Celerinatantimonas sp. MCCC 1A17872]|uniref:baseplate J/gp47 family protein n=1 Tax=Celerinatantimonas sp. MCCC 1A17872 TaxID=3177514 RepID=UPI0038C4EABA